MNTGSWLPDPTQRHQYRWSDGVNWTARIADNGVVGNDPLPTTSAAPPATWNPPKAPVITVRNGNATGPTVASSRKKLLWASIGIAALVVTGVGVVLSLQDDDPTTAPATAPATTTQPATSQPAAPVPATTQPATTTEVESGFGKSLYTLASPTGSIQSVAFSRDGTKIVTGSDDSTAVIWDATTGNQLTTLAGHTDAVDSVAFSPDGTKILTTSYDMTAIIWDATTGARLATLAGHTSGINSYSVAAVFSPDGTKIVTTGEDSTAIIWDAATGNRLAALVHTEHVASAAFSPDGTKIVTSSYEAHDDYLDSYPGTLIIWDAVTGNQLTTLAGPIAQVYSVAFSPDGTKIVTVGFWSVIVWDAATGNQLTTLAHPDTDYSDVGLSAAVSPDGTMIVTTMRNTLAIIWDAATGNQLATLTHTDWFYSVAFSPDGTKIVTIAYDEGTVIRSAIIWDATR